MTAELDLNLPPVKLKSPKPRKPKAPKPPKEKKPNFVKQIILHFVADMQGCYNPAIWGREGRLAKNLLTTYGSEFLLWCPPPEGYKVSSLMWFFCELGKNYLSDQMVEYSKRNLGLLTQPTEAPTSVAKVGEDIVLSTKPKTLKEFLNYGKENRQPS